MYVSPRCRFHRDSHICSNVGSSGSALNSCIRKNVGLSKFGMGKIPTPFPSKITNNENSQCLIGIVSTDFDRLPWCHAAAHLGLILVYQHLYAVKDLLL